MIKFRYLTYSNFGPMAKWYAEMAKKGWEIEKIILPFVHKFKKCQPKDINFRISLAPNEEFFLNFLKKNLLTTIRWQKDMVTTW